MQTNNELSGAWNDDSVYCYGDSYITMDMTVAEQGERGNLVLKLSQKLTSEPLKKMVIRFGKIESMGEWRLY